MSTKTVGLITMHRVLNFGSALQTYATVKMVQSLGFGCTVIDYLYPTLWHTENACGCESLPQESTCKKICKWILKKSYLLNCARSIKRFIMLRKVDEVFRNFLHEVPLTSVSYNRQSILKKVPVFDIYMTGSDQTWNPRYLHTDYSFLLNFVPDDAPKISYAASFGASETGSFYQEDYAKYLKRFDRISVRESSGTELVKKLASKDAVHVLDPTLLLNEKEWSVLNKNKLNLPEKFIFCYILSYVFDSGNEIEKLLEHLHKITGLPIVVYSDSSSSFEKYKQVTKMMGPEGFIECFAKASFVVTTSFHGAAFSVNFHKDFFAVLNPNPSKDDRVKSFLQSVRLDSRGLLLPQTDIQKINLEDLRTDYSESSVCLQKMREHSLAYLKEALVFAAKKCEAE